MGEQSVVNDKVRKAVILLKRYKPFMEDLHDRAGIAERREEKSISIAERKRRLKRDGVL